MPKKEPVIDLSKVGDNSPQLVNNFSGNLTSKDWIFIAIMLVVAVMLGLDISERGRSAQKIAEADKELSRMQAIEKSHHDDAKDELKVAQMLATRLERGCKQ